ncbi:MAG: hypothetical protein LIO79_09525 [Rikenellaceae bacterium]|nr:hypothetical protein [Rikenellaceae bacterium]
MFGNKLLGEGARIGIDRNHTQRQALRRPLWNLFVTTEVFFSNGIVEFDISCTTGEIRKKKVRCCRPIWEMKVLVKPNEAKKDDSPAFMYANDFVTYINTHYAS